MLKLLIVAVLAVGALADQYEAPIQNALEELCKKNGAEDKIQEARNAGSNFISCMRSHINIQSIAAEIAEATPKGTLDDVIKKYCGKTTPVKQCFHALIDGVSPCLDAQSRPRVPDAKAAVDQLFDFLCHSDGIRIALFIAEAGPECFSAKSDAIQGCTATSRASAPNAGAAGTLTEQCAKYDHLTSCVVKALKECSTTYPGNTAESLFSDIRKKSPCKNIQKQN